MANLDELMSMEFPTSNRLKDGIIMKELIEKMSTEFTLDASQGKEQESERETRIDKLHDYEDFAPYINLDCISGCDKELPFEALKKRMTPITEDGKVLKLLLKSGTGDVIPSSCVVYFHYNSYFEMEEVPFDSSYLRNDQPVRMQLGDDGLYPGFKISLLSMKVSEKSQFLVDPDYAFGPVGAPPRIPPDATIFLEIEVHKVVDCGAATDEASEQEFSEKLSFAVCYKKAKAFHLLGNDLFQQKNVIQAINKYKKAEGQLLRCSMDNDEEEEQCKKLLLKIYVNLCICYNHQKVRMPEKVCIMAREAFFTCPEMARKSAKLLFNLGKANLSLNDFKKARNNLRQALAIEPQNKEINDMLLTLEEKQKKYHQHEQITYQRALGLKPKIKQETSQVYNNEFNNVFKEQLREFAKSSNSRLQLPAGLTKEELQICRQISQELGLSLDETFICGKHSIAVVK